MRHRRPTFRKPPRLPAPSLLRPIRYFRRRPSIAIEGWVDEVVGGRVVVSGHQARPAARHARTSVGVDLRKARPSERPHLVPGAYVVLEVRKGGRAARGNRFPLRLARVGRWSTSELERAERRGRELFASLRAIVHEPVS